MPHKNSGEIYGFKYHVIPKGIRRLGFGNFRPLFYIPYWTGTVPKLCVRFTPTKNADAEKLKRIYICVKAPDIGSTKLSIDKKVGEDKSTRIEFGKFMTSSDGELVYWFGNRLGKVSKDWLIKITGVTNDNLILTAFGAILGGIIGAILGAIATYFLAIKFGIGAAT